MPASDVALPLRVGARTVGSLRRRLVRRRITLEEALASGPPALPALGEEGDGFLITALPAGWTERLTAEHAGLTTFVRQRYPRFYARLDQTFDAYFSLFSAKSRSSLRRKLKRLAERSGGSLDARRYRSEEEMLIFHRLAREVSARTYQERLLGAGLPESPEALAGMRDAARAGRARGWLLFVDEQPVSYLYAPAEGRSLIYAHLGYDPDFAHLSPGTMLQLEAMRQLMEERQFALFDFTEGDGQHKRQFATDAIDCVDLLLLRPSLPNRLVGHVLNAFDGAVALGKAVVTAAGLARAARRLRRGGR